MNLNLKKFKCKIEIFSSFILGMISTTSPATASTIVPESKLAKCNKL